MIEWLRHIRRDSSQVIFDANSHLARAGASPMVAALFDNPTGRIDRIEHCSVTGNLVRFEDGCATVTGIRAPISHCAKAREGGSEV